MFYVHNIRMKTDDWLYTYSVNGKQNAIGTSRKTLVSNSMVARSEWEINGGRKLWNTVGY